MKNKQEKLQDKPTEEKRDVDVDVKLDDIDLDIKADVKIGGTPWPVVIDPGMS
jgi:hypothetical protein